MSNSKSFVYKTFPVGPLQCNCTLIGNPQTQEGLVIDPGGDADIILDTAKEMNITIKQIYHTHAHFDHILAAGIIQKKTKAPIYLHPNDQFLWDSVEKQCLAFNVKSEQLPEPNYPIKDEKNICCNGMSIHTPGHTPGSSCFWFEQEKLLIAGDTLFHRSIGRTDLWQGDPKAIITSIKDKLFSLDANSLVITGHGPSTILGEEKKYNPFL